jgi:hypothetical protein
MHMHAEIQYRTDVQRHGNIQQSLWALTSSTAPMLLWQTSITLMKKNTGHQFMLDTMNLLLLSRLLAD